MSVRKLSLAYLAGGEVIVSGTPGARGVAHGRARVVSNLAEACAVSPDEVLVCRTTLPTWTPLFATVATVVADTGGVLSSPATIAREYGIPCVVGTLVGSRVITDGSLLTVDGSRGTVRVHDDLSTAPRGEP